jgi:hypothetical protein
VSFTVSAALAEADGVGVALGSLVGSLDDELPPVKMPVIASPMSSRRLLSLLAEADGDGVAVSPAEELVSLLAEADGVGVGVALSSEPEPEPEPDDEESSEPEPVSDPEPEEEADGDGVAVVSSEPEGLAEADGDSLPSSAVTQSLYSSTVRLFEVGWSAARARVGVKPMPMSTAVGIAAMAIALPAGTWNLVNSGFLGAACRGPTLVPAETAGLSP